MVVTYERPLIDAEFASLIPPQDQSEMTRLEENLVRDGCLDPLRVWMPRNILLDGHTRLRICTKRGIPFKTVEIECASREEAEEWIIRNQLGRRNLDPYTRCQLGEALEKNLAERASANMSAGGKKAAPGRPAEKGSPKSAKVSPIDARKEAAKAAGVSPDTYGKGKAISKAVKAGVLDKDVETKLRSKETTINAEYKKLVAEHPEQVKRRKRKPVETKPWTEGQYESRIEKCEKTLRDTLARCTSGQRVKMCMWIEVFINEVKDESEAA